MQKDHQLPSEENDDLEIIPVIKQLTMTQKQAIINKINNINRIPEDTKLNSSSEHYDV